jgi:hypothetical protein
MLGEREGGREVMALLGADLKSGKGDILLSVERDFRWPKAACGSLVFAAAADTPSPPFRRAFLRSCVASSNMSRVRLGEVAGLTSLE